MFIFGILVKKCIYHVIKGVKRFFLVLVRFDFLKSNLDDTRVRLKKDFGLIKFGLKT